MRRARGTIRSSSSRRLEKGGEKGGKKGGFGVGTINAGFSFWGRMLQCGGGKKKGGGLMEQQGRRRSSAEQAVATAPKSLLEKLGPVE
jgi:hypothetical protein